MSVRPSPPLRADPDYTLRCEEPVAPPGRVDLQVPVIGEQRRDPLPLLVGVQISASAQGAARRKPRISGVAAVAAGLLLESAAAQLQALPGQADDVEGIQEHGEFVIGLRDRGGFGASEALHRNDFHSGTPGLVPFRCGYACVRGFAIYLASNKNLATNLRSLPTGRRRAHAKLRRITPAAGTTGSPPLGPEAPTN